MSSATSQTGLGSPTLIGVPAPERGGRRVGGLIVAAVIVVAAAITLAITDPFTSSGTGRSGAADNAYPTSLTTVTERSLSSQTPVAATLGYAGNYGVVNQAQGTITALPAVGQVIREGQALYSVSGSPVVLLYGATPAYRTLSAGMTGADVQELNVALVALGYAASSQLTPTSDYFGSATTSVLEKLQAALGVSPNGTLTLGQAVFLPGPLRATTMSATLGGTAQPGQPVIQGTSTAREVTIALDAAQQSEVKVGDKVTITLPNNSITPGVVASVGTVATNPPSGQNPNSNNSTPTVTVDVTPTDPAATGNLDQAPVEVSITTATVNNALVVPVSALLALSSGGYAVEVSDSSGTHTLVPVEVGLFDAADSLVQVSGAGLSAGQQVVVPAS